MSSALSRFWSASRRWQRAALFVELAAQQAQEKTDIRDDAGRLDRAAVGKFGDDGGVDIDTASFTPAGVMFPTPIECSIVEGIRIISAPRISRAYSACALIHLGLEQRAVIADRAGERKGHAFLHALVENPAAHDALLDGRRDAATAPDSP
jgi:hypothetical protein